MHITGLKQFYMPNGLATHRIHEWSLKQLLYSYFVKQHTEAKIIQFREMIFLWIVYSSYGYSFNFIYTQEDL